MLEGGGLVAHLPDEVGGVGDDDDRPAFGLERLHLVDALPLEGLVADREDLVDEEDLRVDVDGHGEAQPNVHPRRVVLHRRVDERLELGEADDVVEDPVDLGVLEPEDRPVEVDVLTAGELRVKAGAEFEQRRHSPGGADDAGGRLDDAGHALEERALARAVGAEEADGGPGLDVEIDVAQRGEVLVADASELEDPFLERSRLLPVEPERLGEALDLDRRGHRRQSSSARLPSRRLNTRRAKAARATTPAVTIARLRAYHANVRFGSSTWPNSP